MKSRLFRIGLCSALSTLCTLCLSCAQNTPLAPEATPQWLSAFIRSVEMRPVAEPPITITRYEYKTEKVYFVPSRCCDIWSDLYRADGTLLCHPDGGLTGAGDGRCREFVAERTNAETIWQDPRGAR